jgi:hypothetical protein
LHITKRHLGRSKIIIVIVNLHGAPGILLSTKKHHQASKHIRIMMTKLVEDARVGARLKRGVLLGALLAALTIS